ncbi:uncharacterized protein LOC119695537 [Motacilla alba alba]|uniref:uncharacterized protein LOC119695537 n=1 Tax=Motacilla alba alba TaxID=1094192 RepID=UPI0018D54FF1|nr:uncharacterized protein LOC119695537 [Motacilla alba alba]
MSLPDDENYPRTTTTSAQSFLSWEAELHSVSTHTTGQKQTAIPLLHTECWAAGLRGPARCWRGQGGEGETRRGDYLSKSASESNENPREGERNPPPSLLRGAAAAAGPPPPPRSRRRRGDNITTIIRAGRGAGSSSVSSSVQRTCRAGGCAAEANPFPPSLLHNINTGRAAPRRTGSEPGRAEGGRGAALPRGRRRRRRSLRECERRRAGRGGLGTHGGEDEEEYCKRLPRRRADLERALKLNPQRRQPLQVGHSLELLSPLMPFLCGCERPRRRNRNTRCSKHCRGEGFPDGHTEREWLSKMGFLDEHWGKYCCSGEMSFAGG